MKDAINKLGGLLLAMGLMATASGCSHQIQSSNDGSAAYSLLPQQQAEDQFIKDVGNLPINQRKAYVENHSDTLDRLKMDPDKSKMDQLDSLMPPEIP